MLMLGKQAFCGKGGYTTPLKILCGSQATIACTGHRKKMRQIFAEKS